MGEVFSKVETTRVWLGASSQDSGLAISFVKTAFSVLPESEIGDNGRTKHYGSRHPQRRLE